LNLPLDQLPSRIAAVRDDLRNHLETPVYVICQTSSRAAHAARLLRKVGFMNVSVIAGGMSSWQSQSFATTQGTAD